MFSYSLGGVSTFDRHQNLYVTSQIYIPPEIKRNNSNKLFTLNNSMEIQNYRKRRLVYSANPPLWLAGEKNQTTSKWEGQGGETELRRRTGWLENGGKWCEENAWLEEYVACWKNKLRNCLDMVGMCITYYTKAHSWRLVNFYGAYSWLKTIWLPHISPCTSFFCQSISGFFPSVSPNFYSLVLSLSLLSFTLLQIKEVVLCAD